MHPILSWRHLYHTAYSVLLLTMVTVGCGDDPEHQQPSTPHNTPVDQQKRQLDEARQQEVDKEADIRTAKKQRQTLLTQVRAELQRLDEKRKAQQKSHAQDIETFFTQAEENRSNLRAHLLQQTKTISGLNEKNAYTLSGALYWDIRSVCTKHSSDKRTFQEFFKKSLDLAKAYSTMYKMDQETEAALYEDIKSVITSSGLRIQNDSEAIILDQGLAYHCAQDILHSETLSSYSDQINQDYVRACNETYQKHGVTREDLKEDTPTQTT